MTAQSPPTGGREREREGEGGREGGREREGEGGMKVVHGREVLHIIMHNYLHVHCLATYLHTVACIDAYKGVLPGLHSKLNQPSTKGSGIIFHLEWNRTSASNTPLLAHTHFLPIPAGRSATCMAD